MIAAEKLNFAYKVPAEPRRSVRYGSSMTGKDLYPDAT